MNYVPMLVEPCAEHHSSVGNNLFGEQGKYSAGRGVASYFLIGVDGCINAEGLVRFGGVQYRTDLFAQPAMDADCRICHRIAEPFAVFLHRDTLPGATLYACRASATFVFVENPDHFNPKYLVMPEGNIFSKR